MKENLPAKAPITPTRITVFQEKNSGREKIAGISEFGKHIEFSRIINIEGPLPDLIDDPEAYILDRIDGDLVLSFLKHPDLAEYLVRLCNNQKIPVIAAGKKIPGAISPFTCCGLGRHQGLGHYGEQFGFPEFEVTTEGNKIVGLTVKRGASCGATWEAAAALVGKDSAEALLIIAREVQYLCTADPAAFDPLSGKSALHYAGDVHFHALKKALRSHARRSTPDEEITL